jgi:putative membrane protein
MTKGFVNTLPVLLLAAASAAHADLSSSDKKFFDKAALAGLVEVAEGKLAVAQGSDPKVKAFGQQMVTDHTKANEELNQLAQKKDVSLPTAPEPKQEKAIAKLGAKSGTDFDKAYADNAVDDHKDAVDLFEKASKSSDPDIAAFATKTLPTLQSHLDMAKALPK